MMYAIIPFSREYLTFEWALLSIINAISTKRIAIDGSEDPLVSSSRFLSFHCFSINDHFAFMIHEANVTRKGSARLRLSAARAANTSI